MYVRVLLGCLFAEVLDDVPLKLPAERCKNTSHLPAQTADVILQNAKRNAWVEYPKTQMETSREPWEKP